MLESSISHKDHVIEIHQDTYNENPCETWDFLGRIISFHKRYSFGHRHDFKHPDDFKEFVACEKPAILMPIYGYDHGSLTIKTEPFSDPWDSGHVGWIYSSRQKILESWNCRRLTKKILDQARNTLRSEVNIVDMWINGDVYGFVIKDENNHTIDSSWGFYGPPEESGLLKTAKDVIDQCLINVYGHGAHI